MNKENPLVQKWADPEIPLEESGGTGTAHGVNEGKGNMENIAGGNLHHPHKLGYVKIEEATKTEADRMTVRVGP